MPHTIFFAMADERMNNYTYFVAKECIIFLVLYKISISIEERVCINIYLYKLDMSYTKETTIEWIKWHTSYLNQNRALTVLLNKINALFNL